MIQEKKFVYKQDMALNNAQGLICYKTQPNQSKLLVWSWE